MKTAKYSFYKTGDKPFGGTEIQLAELWEILSHSLVAEALCEWFSACGQHLQWNPEGNLLKMLIPG